MTTITEIDKKIAELEAQKTAILAEEKEAALARAHEAIGALKKLGYHYQLTEVSANSSRRSGVKDSVLELIKSSNGISPAQMAAKLGIQDKSGKQAIANALTALKKADIVKADSGKYALV